MSLRFAIHGSAVLLLLSACANGGSRPPDLGRPLDAHVDAPHDLGHGDGGTGDLGGSSDLGDVDLGGGTDLGGSSDLGDVDLGGGTDLGAMDVGGHDLGTPDAGCTSAAACSDGIACNGIERCIAGACSPGTTVVCDDGIACTHDACSEPTGTCSFTRDDTSCPPGYTCTAATTSGCASTSTCSESPCRLVAPQCGCGTGLACTISGTTRTCATPGTGGPGASCTTSCATGNLCVQLTSGASPPAGCEHFCNNDSDCVGAGSVCILTLNDGTGGTIPGVTLCSIACNPSTSTGGGCPGSSTCRVFQDTATARLLTHCSTNGAGLEGDVCSVDDDCGSGMGCFDTGFGLSCTRWCNLATGTGCSVFTSCTDVFAAPVIIGSTQYGLCI